MLPRGVSFTVIPVEEEARTATATLALTLPGGTTSAASHPLVVAATHRNVLNSLAGSFAECAMALGLGSGVYRRCPGEREKPQAVPCRFGESP